MKLKDRWDYAVASIQEVGVHAKFVWDKSTDGCSFVPDFNFFECCKEHDIDYRNGRRPKLVADFKLGCCIAKKGHPGLGVLYFTGTAVLGWFAYRWDRRRQYKRINRADG